MKPVVAIGHRGAKGHEPENTLLGIERAIALGADWIEIDVHRVNDRLVVIHDRFLDRTTSGKGAVAGQTIEYLRSLDAGKGQKIPFLHEVFDLINRRARLNIELKDDIAAPLVAETIADYRRNRGWTPDDLIVCSFLHAQLERMRSMAPDLHTGVLIGALTDETIAMAMRIGAFSVNPSFDSVKQELVDKAHRTGLQICPYTVNEPEAIHRMIGLGVDGIISDFPDRVIRARR